MSLGHDDFKRDWKVEILRQPPLIAPARQFTWPLHIAGEEDALARGALRLLVRPASGGVFLATCALGFTDPAMPTAVYGSPNPGEICAVAGGYAYIAEVSTPERCMQIPMKPVAEVVPLPEHGLLLFVGFHTIAAWGKDGVAWTSGKLSWEGLKLTSISGDKLHGLGWNMLTDRDVPFELDLRTGEHSGGGFSK
ncbi:hypothetical protein SAMN05421770_105258 [Granulicella rosea]|uniref:Uncharacterized protein n=1 Tax=Granulicella rosea TaxID=474952 RepID=A0A239KYP4_9BACT|nr:hypothetical protein [Granulicella rosea]SNT22384.1 hypothetical protein SAMN05421770_105258 [Granulicella rosea]